jgi:daunorubicin resistance ABC transporter membrane protein
VSGIANDLRTIGVLWKRDLMLFARQRSRIAGTLIQPLLLWLAIGGGMAPTFRLGTEGVGYMEYFFPGVVLLMVLMTSLFSTMSVIEDRHQGFLQGVLVAPGSRAAVVLGKSLGCSTVAMIQAGIFLLFAPFAGFSLGSVRWYVLVPVLGLTAMALTAVGFAVAWWLDSIQGYHVVMSVVLFPLWILSGAMFPPEGLHPILRTIVLWNPLSYSVAALRRAIHGGSLHEGTGLPGLEAGIEMAVISGTAVAAVAVAAWTCARLPAAGGGPTVRKPRTGAAR